MKTRQDVRGRNPSIVGNLVFVLIFFTFLYPATGEALDYPTKPIYLVVGTPPGGPADAAARAIAEESSKELKIPFVVMNKPGASGSIAAASVAGAKPDGY